MFNVNVFQIGGSRPEAFLGCAHCLDTARSLVALARLQGASGVSLHGTLPHLRDRVSGEFTLSAAEREIDTAEQCVADRIIREEIALWRAEIT